MNSETCVRVICICIQSISDLYTYIDMYMYNYILNPNEHIFSVHTVHVLVLSTFTCVYVCIYVSKD